MKTASRPTPNPSQEASLTGLDPASFLTLFWVITAAIVCYSMVTWSGRPVVFTLSALLIAFFALLPSYFWCSRTVRGLPIFPLFCASFIITHAFQLLVAYPKLQDYGVPAIWRAALTVSGFLLIATVVWRLWLAWHRPLPAACRALRGERGTTLFLLVVAASTVFMVLSQANWLGQLPGGVFTAIRGFIRGLTSFAVFVLAMRWGAGKLRPSQTAIFLALFVALCIADASSLFLVAVIGTCLMMLIGFTIGRKRVPWVMLTAMVFVLALLHIGKAQMRLKYWEEGQYGQAVKPWDYPALFAEWGQASLAQLISQRQLGEEHEASIFERANTIYLLLQAQAMTPEVVPYLHGATYAIIPDALVPRLFHPEKVSPHDSTTMLNVHYGNQTVEDAQSTSIGWGLLNEAFANFGLAGCFVLAVILGTFYGLVTRWNIGLPSASLPSIIGIFTMGFALQTEMTAAIFITAYAQGLFAVLVLFWFFAERQTLRPAEAVRRRVRGGRSKKAGTPGAGRQEIEEGSLKMGEKLKAESRKQTWEIHK